MEKKENIATALDQFAKSYDPYEYADCVDDPIQNIIETARLIRNGKTEGIIEWLQAIVDDSDEGTEESETASLLLRTIKERKKEYESTYD